MVDAEERVENDFHLEATKGSRHPPTIKANSMRFVIISHYTRNDKPKSRQRTLESRGGGGGVKDQMLEP